MSYFVKVDDATELRRKILESSKASINILRGYQHALLVRNKKLTLMKQLRRDLKELTMLVNRMETLMPTLSKGQVAELNKRSEPTPKRRKKRRKKSKKQAPLEGEKVYLGHPEIKEVPPPRPEPELPKPVRREKKSKDKTELEKLQDKLASIENKLGNI